jgi:hypothetical protein
MKKKVKKTARKKPVRKASKKTAPKKKAAPKKKPARVKKPAAKAVKPVVKEVAELPWRKSLPGEFKLGVVQDFYGHLGVIVFTLEAPLAVGDNIHVRGHTTDVTQLVESIQIEHRSVSQAAPKDGVGIKVTDRCRAGDYVYKVSV